jgi:hypothetical protein
VSDKRTKRKPEEDAASFLGIAPTREPLLESVTFVRVRVFVWILATRLSEGGYGDDESVRATVVRHQPVTQDKRTTYAIRKLVITPVPARIKATRISLSARASLMNLSYFS